MTNLRDLMHQTVEHDHADLVRLAAGARSHGTILRRRRRLAVLGSSLGVLVLVGAGFAAAGALLPGVGESGESTAFAGQGSGTGSGGPQCSDARDDLELTAAPRAGKVLKAAVRSVAEGTISDVSADRVSATCHHPEMVTGSLMFAPADGSPAGQVAVAFLKPGEFGSAESAEAYVSTCSGGDADELEDCGVSTLPDGTKLRTYATRMELEGGNWQTLVAERLVDGYVLSVTSYGPRAENKPGTVLGDPVLSTDQIVDLAAQLSPIR